MGTIIQLAAGRLLTTQSAIERLVLGISLRDHVLSEEIRRRTKAEDVIGRIVYQKWSWVGQVARQNLPSYGLETMNRTAC